MKICYFYDIFREFYSIRCICPKLDKFL